MILFASSLAFIYAILPRHNKWVWYFAISALILASGLRVDVGRDFSIYESLFQGNTPVSGIDPGFLMTAHSLAEIDQSGRLAFLVSSMIIVLGYILFIKEFSRDKGISLILFLSVPIFFINSFNLLRVHMAIALVLMCFVFIHRRKHFFIKLATYVAGISTHFSALIYIAAMPIFYFYKKRLLRVLLFIGIASVALLIFLYERSIIPASMSYFLDHEANNSRILIPLFAFVNLVLIYFATLKDRSAYGRLVFIFSILYAVFIVLWLNSAFANLWLRVSSLFAPVLLLSFSYFFYKLRIDDAYVKFLFRLIFVSLAYIIFIVKYISDPQYGFVHS